MVLFVSGRSEEEVLKEALLDLIRNAKSESDRLIAEKLLARILTYEEKSRRDKPDGKPSR